LVVPSGFVNVAVSTESTVTVIWSSIGEVVTILSGKLKAKTISFRWSVAGLSLLGFETGVPVTVGLELVVAIFRE
jgi:hypothetical protein